MKTITFDRQEDRKIRMTDQDGEWSQTSSIEANLLFSMLEKLDEICRVVIDIETEGEF